ncbi:MAG: hypothetical protein IJT36_01375 [Alphaproteobacteria bacterium]|nr:hypothetical protein [Alphaproteobacteria bacterium]
MKRIIALLLLVPFCILINSCKKEDLGTDDKIVVLADETGLENAFIVREIKRTYMGKDIEILYIKNDTENDYLLTVSGLFQKSETSDSVDSVERTKPLFSQTEICFIFQSRTPFDRFEYQILSQRKEYTNEGSFDYTPQVFAKYGPNPVDVNEGHEKIRVDVYFNVEFQSNFSDEKRIYGTLIFFDNNGEIYWMCDDYVLHSIPGTQYKMIVHTIDDPSWDGNNDVPDNLKGVLEVAFDYEY